LSETAAPEYSSAPTLKATRAQPFIKTPEAYTVFPTLLQLPSPQARMSTYSPPSYRLHYKPLPTTSFDQYNRSGNQCHPPLGAHTLPEKKCDGDCRQYFTLTCQIVLSLSAETQDFALD